MAVLRTGALDRICLHHAAVNGIPKDLTELKKRLAGYEKTHATKTWAQTTKTGGEHGYYYLAYHLAIAGNGHEMRTQDDKYVMYHAGDNARGAESFNLHGVGVLIDGNYMTDKPNALQEEAFARIIARYQKKYKVDVIVRGHKETSLTATSCPGTNLGTHTSGFLKRAITRANEIIAKNLPTNPIQEDKPIPPVEPPVTPPPTECEKEVIRLNGVIDGLNKSLADSQAQLKLVQAVANENMQSYLELQKKYDALHINFNRVENEKNEAIAKLNAGLVGVSAKDMFAELWRRLTKSLDREA